MLKAVGIQYELSISQIPKHGSTLRRAVVNTVFALNEQVRTEEEGDWAERMMLRWKETSLLGKDFIGQADRLEGLNGLVVV